MVSRWCGVHSDKPAKQNAILRRTGACAGQGQYRRGMKRSGCVARDRKKTATSMEQKRRARLAANWKGGFIVEMCLFGVFLRRMRRAKQRVWKLKDMQLCLWMNDGNPLERETKELDDGWTLRAAVRTPKGREYCQCTLLFSKHTLSLSLQLWS
ncbi:hypothetical protein NL676_038436 [Syzygium grande]|nr:hypothetical protein NL676_038436 [Syzygium grande]